MEKRSKLFEGPGRVLKLSLRGGGGCGYKLFLSASPSETEHQLDWSSAQKSEF